MAREIRQYEVSVPAGTTAAAPQLTGLTMPARIVRHVRIRIPRGPNGKLGFALASSGVPIIPWNAGAWIVADDETFDWDLDNQINSGAWQLRAYNTGAYAHTVYLTFELDPPQRARAGGVFVPIPADQLSGGSIYPPIDTGGGAGNEGTGGGADEPPPFEQDIGEDPIVDDGTGPVLPPAEPDDGYGIARVNAVHAVQAALGATITTPGQLPPAPGTVARLGYDAGRQAAISALELV